MTNAPLFSDANPTLSHIDLDFDEFPEDESSFFSLSDADDDSLRHLQMLRRRRYCSHFLRAVLVIARKVYKLRIHFHLTDRKRRILVKTIELEEEKIKKK